MKLEKNIFSILLIFVFIFYPLSGEGIPGWLKLVYIINLGILALAVSYAFYSLGKDNQE